MMPRASRSATALAVGAAAALATFPLPVIAEHSQPHRELKRARDLHEAGDIRQAGDLYRLILHDDPHNDAAYRSLLEIAGATDLSALSGPAKAAQQRLPARFNVHQTQRFVVYSDLSEEQTRQSGEWMERAYDEFMRIADASDWRPLPLQHKLVCILFESRSEYFAFAKSQDGLRNINFTGYYSPRHDRVVFSMEPHGEVAAGRAAPQPTAQVPVAQSTGDKSVLGFQTGESAPDAVESHRGHDHVHVGHAHSPDAAKCVHEVIHQLMFHTWIMSPDVQYPLWICEGLSTAFETERPQEAFGPDRDFAPRRAAFQMLLKENDLLPLRDLVTMTDLSSSKPRQLRVVYQQSYALVTWLSRERPEQLRDYLRLMRMQSSGRLSAAQHLALFEQAFGEVEQVEDAWLQAERSKSHDN